MKRIFVFVLQLTLLSACVPLTLQLSTPIPSLTPSLQPTVIIPPATVTLTPTAAEVLPTATATVVLLSGPKMEIGSMYRYVDGTTLVAVPEGEFRMGAAGEDNPVHTVKLNNYWIYQTEVTNSQYARCVSASKCAPPDSTENKHFADALWSNDPVVGVTYDQAVSYCSWVNASLPTEAQWEKAARGPDGNQFPWGNTAPACGLLNYNYCVGQTTDVSTHIPGKSYYGALDMAGNVFEWVADWYDPVYYTTSPGNDPTGPSDGDKRAVRSSSYESGGDQSMPAKR
jgi:formylglycine-generating enzyme required for sulfatase activity